MKRIQYGLKLERARAFLFDILKVSLLFGLDCCSECWGPSTGPLISSRPQPKTRQAYVDEISFTVYFYLEKTTHYAACLSPILSHILHFPSTPVISSANFLTVIVFANKFNNETSLPNSQTANSSARPQSCYGCRTD